MIGKFAYKIIFILAVIAILGFSVQGFAQMGMGQHHYEDMHHGAGWHHHGYGPRAHDPWVNLSEDEIKQLEEERKAFFEATKEIRQQLYQKWLEIRSELAKKNPDAEIAANIQKEISDLRAQMGRKRLDHILKLKKINPDVGRGFMGRGRMGYGIMDPGGYGGCPNYPYQVFGRDPAMVGPGWGRHMMPGWSGRNYALPYQPGKRPLERSNK